MVGQIKYEAAEEPVELLQVNNFIPETLEPVWCTHWCKQQNGQLFLLHDLLFDWQVQDKHPSYPPIYSHRLASMRRRGEAGPALLSNSRGWMEVPEATQGAAVTPPQDALRRRGCRPAARCWLPGPSPSLPAMQPHTSKLKLLANRKSHTDCAASIILSFPLQMAQAASPCVNCLHAYHLPTPGGMVLLVAQHVQSENTCQPARWCAWTREQSGDELLHTEPPQCHFWQPEAGAHLSGAGAAAPLSKRPASTL